MNKKLLLLIAVFAVGVCLRSEAQTRYFTQDQMPDLVKCLPAPPDTIGSDFDHDVLRYMWGKKMRNNPERAAIARRDACWVMDTLAAIFSVPFGLKISEKETPEIYRAFMDGIGTIEQIRVAPKAHYMRLRPFVVFNEPSLNPDEDEELSGEGSYPSGHTIRGWSAALILSEINPDAAEALYERGWDYGESRVISGAHWQSDVDMSRAAASIGYSFIQTSPAFRLQMEKAKAEFRRVTRKDR
jgi:acid phosphatase (class A)